MTETKNITISDIETLLSDDKTKIVIKNKSFGAVQKMSESQYRVSGMLTLSEEKEAHNQMKKFEESLESGMLVVLSADEDYIKSNIPYLKEIYANKDTDDNRQDFKNILLPETLSSEYWTDILLMLDSNASDIDNKKLVFSRATLILPTIYHGDFENKIKVSMAKLKSILALQPKLFKKKFKNATSPDNTFPKVLGFGQIEMSKYDVYSVGKAFIPTYDGNTHRDLVELFANSNLFIIYDYILSRYDLHFDENGDLKILPMVKPGEACDGIIPEQIPEIDEFIQPFIETDIQKFLSEDAQSFNDYTLAYVLQKVLPDVPTFNNGNRFSYYSDTLFSDYRKLSQIFEYSQIVNTEVSVLTRVYNIYHDVFKFEKTSKKSQYLKKHMALLSESQSDKQLTLSVLFQYETSTEKSFDTIEHTQYKNTATLLAQLAESRNSVYNYDLAQKRLFITDSGLKTLTLSDSHIEMKSL
mgnify:CR=1 FL=1